VRDIYERLALHGQSCRAIATEFNSRHPDLLYAGRSGGRVQEQGPSQSEDPERLAGGADPQSRSQSRVSR
jgi:hypothetical protein